MNAVPHMPSTMRIFERGWLSSNNILFTGDAETVLVDTGYLSHAGQTLALVQHALGERRLDRIINTHLHSDHCGGNAILQGAYACRTAIPATQADDVRNWDQGALTFAATGQRCEPFGFTETLAHGDVLTLGDLSWQVLAAPGHDPDSLMLYCPDERILISADALWEHGFGVVFPEIEGASGFAETRATLELIAALDVALVIPGHGAPFHDVSGALARAFGRLDYLSADPSRNARNAVKVFLKFLLLEHQRLPREGLAQTLGGMALFREANRRYLHQDETELVDWTVQELVRLGAARIDGAWLLNHD